MTYIKSKSKQEFDKITNLLNEVSILLQSDYLCVGHYDVLAPMLGNLHNKAVILKARIICDLKQGHA